MWRGPAACGAKQVQAAYRAARGHKEQDGTRMVWARRRPVGRPGYSHAVTVSCRRLRRVLIPILLLSWY